MTTAAGDATVLTRLRAGDMAAFDELVRRHHPAMVRVAETYVPSRAVAEEVAQDTWIAVLRGLDGFEERSSLRTWIFRILVNRARTSGVREHRSVPLSSLDAELAADEASVDPDRFTGPAGHGMWSRPPQPWSSAPEEGAMNAAMLAIVAATAPQLPENQRRVLVLRDIEGWTSDEVCRLLELTEGNQRVLLHRARSKVRAAIEAGWGEQA